MHQRPNEVEIVGAPVDLGCNLRGANIAPATIRIAGLAEKLAALGIKAVDSGDIAVPLREVLGPAAANEHYVQVITGICEELCLRVGRALGRGCFPLTLGGDHSIAIGTINGAANYFRHQGGQLGLIWVDAHADMNTQLTSPSGNVHGMPLSVVLGYGHPQLVNVGGLGSQLRPESVALIGIRNLDEGEKEFVRKTGIHYFTMTDVDQRGIYAIISDALDRLSRHCTAIHLSFDLDSVDPLWAPGVSTPVPGGLTYREAHLLLETVASAGLLRSMEFVELNPMYDTNHQTAKLCVELALSALGKAIV
jgi:arginase